jgi:hypothetical protein
MTSRPLRVFLCHSSADKPAVRELYQKLRAESWIEPWLDEEELFPGMDWNMEIEKAVEATDVIIVCLSKNSITKEGYVQKEIKIALDFSDYKPEGTVFIIPVRLEECTPPLRLSKWQYADYFEDQREQGFEKLLFSLKTCAKSFGVFIVASILKSQAPKLTNSNLPTTNQSSIDTFKATKGKCERLWAYASNMAVEGATGSTILDAIYIPAKKLVDEALAQYPESLDIIALKDRAQLEYNDARRKYQILTTSDVIGSYKSEWEFLRRLKNQEEKIPLVDSVGRPLGVFTVREAILELEKRAEEYAHNKLWEYLAEARHLLEIHNPEAARTELEKSTSLWMLHPEDMGLIEKEIKNIIDPEIKELQAARRLLREAELASHPHIAWEKLNEAVKQYPYIRGVDTARLEIANRILSRVELVLKNYDTNLKDGLKSAYELIRQINDHCVGRTGYEDIEMRSNKLLEQIRGVLNLS